MLKETVEEVFGQAYKEFIRNRTDGILFSMQNDTSSDYYNYNEECVHLFDKLRDLLGKFVEDKSLLQDYESAETAAMASALEIVYRQGIEDGIKLLKSKEFPYIK